MSESRTRSSTPLIIGLVAIVVLLLCCCLVVAGVAIARALPWPEINVFDLRVEATERIEKTFEVGTPATLVVDVNVGDVVIRAGDGDKVRIYAVKHAWGGDRQQAEEYLGDFKVQIRQRTTGEVEIEAQAPRKLPPVRRAPMVDLEITVPREAKLDVVVNVGQLEVTGVRGTFDLRASVGDVSLRDVRFEADSQIVNGVGSIELRLPEDSVFAFSAESNVGSVSVGFPIRNEHSEDRLVGESIEGEIGRSPTVYVELRTNTGDIRIRRE